MGNKVKNGEKTGVINNGGFLSVAAGKNDL